MSLWQTIRGLRLMRTDGGVLLAAKQPRRRSQSVRKVKRGFDAAATDRLQNGWNTTVSSPNEILKADLASMKARSRNECINNDWARNFIVKLRQNVVGPQGFITQVRITDPDGSQDDGANRSVERALKDWSQGKHCDVSGRMTYPDMQRLWISTVGKDGESIVRKWQGPGKYGYALEFIDTLMLDIGLNDTRSTNEIIMGVEVDAAMRPVRYYFKDAKSSVYGAYQSGPKHVHVRAEDIMHSFMVEDAGQVRGWPWLSVSLPRMHMLDGYEDAALVNARWGANTVAVLRSDPEHYQGPMPGDGTDGDGTPLIDSEMGEIPDIGTRMLDKFESEYPKGEFPSFVQHNLRGVAAGLGIPYHTLTGDLTGANYSSLREGKLDGSDLWLTLQDWMRGEFIIPNHNAFIENALAVGAITLDNGKPLPMIKLDKFQAADHQGRRWAWVDPAKEMAAKVQGIDAHITTISETIRERGRDPEEVFREAAAERKLIADINSEYGIPASTQGAADNGSQGNTPADQDGEPAQAGDGD